MYMYFYKKTGRIWSYSHANLGQADNRLLIVIISIIVIKSRVTWKRLSPLQFTLQTQGYIYL